MTPPSVSPERERRHVEEEQVFTSPRGPPLERRADRDDLVRVDPLCGSLPNSSLTSAWIRGIRVWPPTEDDLVDPVGSQAGVLEGLAAGGDRALQDVLHHRLELRPRQLDRHVLRPGGVGVMKGRLISVSIVEESSILAFSEASFRRCIASVLREVDPLVLLELGEEPVGDPLVDVVASEVGVAVGRLHLDDALAHLENRDVEGAAAEVVDGDRLVLLLVEAVGERRGGRLVDEALDFSPAICPASFVACRCASLK